MMNKDGEGRRHVPCLWLRTSYPHDTGQLRMLVHANLYRAIVYERSRTLCRFQRFQLRDGSDLTPVLQPDSELTPSAQRHNMTVQQLAVFSAWARHLTTPPVFQPLTSLPVVGLPGWSSAGSPGHCGQRWPEHEVARSPRRAASLGSRRYRGDCERAWDSAASPAGSPPRDTPSPDFYGPSLHRPGPLHPAPRRHR